MKKVKLRQRLAKKFADREYRSVYADSHLDAAIALQIRALRTQKGLSQQELAAKAGLKQSQISAMEQTCFDSWTLKTLRKLAQAFELPLLVKFTSWGEMLDDACLLSPEDLERPSFEDDSAFTRHGGREEASESTAQEGEVIYPDFCSHVTASHQSTDQEGEVVYLEDSRVPESPQREWAVPVDLKENHG